MQYTYQHHQGEEHDSSSLGSGGNDSLDSGGRWVKYIIYTVYCDADGDGSIQPSVFQESCGHDAWE